MRTRTSEAKRVYVQVVIVEGREDFPIDMMRYDSCVPFSESDSHAIVRSMSGSAATATTRVALRRFAASVDAGPTVRRWEFMGWLVVAYGVESNSRIAEMARCPGHADPATEGRSRTLNIP
jgi:hypothetical protein